MKKVFSILACILIFALSFCVPAFAYTVDPDPGVRLKPLYNLESIETISRDGRRSLFEFPSNFFTTSPDIQNSYITLDSLNGDPYTLNFANIDIFDFGEGIYLLHFELSLYAVQDIVFHYGNSYVPFTTLGGDDTTFIPVQIAQTEYLSTSGSFSSKGVQRVDDPISSRVLQYNGILSQSFSNVVESGYFVVSPNNTFIQASADYAISNGYLSGSIDPLCILKSDFTISSTSTTFTNLDVVIPMISASTPNSDSESYLFNNFRFVIGNNNASFGSIGEFLAGSLNAFLGFEFAPGFSLGTLFVAIVGLLAVIAFLRWFAGG